MNRRQCCRDWLFEFLTGLIVLLSALNCALYLEYTKDTMLLVAGLLLLGSWLMCRAVQMASVCGEWLRGQGKKIPAGEENTK